MFTIQIIANCPQGHGEVDPKSLEGAECLIEESVSLLLVQLFGSVLVDRVSVTYSPLENARGNLLSPAA
jgi:hypothetical protein